MRTLAEKSFSLIHKTKNQGCKEKLLGAYIKDLWPQSLAMCHISSLARLNKAQAESSSPTVGRDIGQGGEYRRCAQPASTPGDETFFSVFAFKICLPHQAVTPFLDSANPLKNTSGSAFVVYVLLAKREYSG